MCYGSQEYFTSCLHPGNFHIREYCHNWSGCQSRIEEQTIHVHGFCPGCQHSVYTDQPRGRVDRPRDAGTQWNSYEEMADYYTRRIDAAEERLTDAQYYYDHNPHGFREGVELRNAQSELEDAKRSWERDSGEFQAEETRNDDRMSYEAEAYDEAYGYDNW